MTTDIRTPLRSELRACRMMLPETFERGVKPELLLAVNPEPLRFLGAIGYGLVLFEGRPAWRLRLHVVRGHRRQQLGTQLIRSLAARGVERHISTLMAVQYDKDPDAQAFLSSLGFTPVFRSSSYDVEVEHYRSIVCPLSERLHRRGKVPAGARVVTIDEAPRDALAELLGQHARSTQHSVGTPWSDAWERQATREASTVLMLDDDVIGAIVAERHGTSAEVSWRVVRPEHRGGWANVLLNAATYDRMARIGVRQVRFSTTTNTPDTEHFVRRHGAVRAEYVDHHVLSLGAFQGTPS